MLLVAILETARLGCFDPLQSPGVAVTLVVGLCLALVTDMTEFRIFHISVCRHTAKAVLQVQRRARFHHTHLRIYCVDGFRGCWAEAVRED